MVRDSPISESHVRNLLLAAADAMDRAHAPYSEYAVGAAVLTAEGAVYAACNVEMKPTTNTLHAEQRAVAKAVEAGEMDIRACGLITSADDAPPPCGNCLQALATFNPAMEVVVAETDAEAGYVPGETAVTYHAVDTLLPEAYVD